MATPPFDEERRRGLHAELDALLDARAELERECGVPSGTSLTSLLPYGHLSSTLTGFKARQLLNRAAAFAASILGTPIRGAALQLPAKGGPAQRSVLLEWLTLVKPLFSLPSTFLPEQQEYLNELDVWVALRALEAGEVWPIFEPGKRGNRPANLYSLSVARLRALEWKRRLIAIGYSEGDANREITAAFGEQWDTIRKWQTSCSATLGESYVRAVLSSAEHWRPERRPGGFFSRGIAVDPLQLLRFSGDQYRSELRRAAELSRAKQKAARRLEK